MTDAELEGRLAAIELLMVSALKMAMYAVLGSGEDKADVRAGYLARILADIEAGKVPAPDDAAARAALAAGLARMLTLSVPPDSDPILWPLAKPPATST